MRLLFFIWISAFTFLAFTSSVYISKNEGSFYDYYSYLIYQILSNPALFLALLIFSILLLASSKKASTKLHLLLVNFQVILISFFSSALIIFLVAILELNILSILISKNPGIIGIHTNHQSILTRLDKSSQVPDIITSDPNGYVLLRKYAIASSGKHNYFGKYLLTSIPDSVLLEINNINSSMSLIDNTLIISDINTEELESVSKILAYKAVQNYFSGRQIKSDVEISILDSNDYKIFREYELEKKAHNIANEIINLQQQLIETELELENDKNEISELNEQLETIYNQRNLEHRNCLSEGKYISGNFVKTNTETYCREKYDLWSSRVSEKMNLINISEELIIKTQNQISQFDTLITFIKAQQVVLRVLENNIPREYGAFQPEKSIGIAFIPDSPHVILDYMGTLIHEYLHFASFISENVILSDSFFEEGLTEYFSRKILNKYLNTTSNIGYPAITQVITQMSNRIPESELAEIYFEKNQAKLETTLNRVYGENFYKENRILFITLQYTSDLKDIVKYTNIIMSEIGGNPVSETDITSTYSKL